jgi:hypothetical protein
MMCISLWSKVGVNSPSVTHGYSFVSRRKERFEIVWIPDDIIVSLRYKMSKTMKKVMLIMAGWVLCMAASAQKETKVYQFDKPLYGAAYYAEYTPTDRLDEDIRLMKEAHLTVVRVSESTWSLFEPQDGQFEFA